MGRRCVKTGLALIVFAILPWVVVIAVNTPMGTPPPTFDPDQCTRHCHDHGCSHPPILPAEIAGDAGLYGETIRALKKSGRATGLGARRGYGAMNLIVFCVVWPGLMLGLLVIAIWQSMVLRDGESI